ncbi:uncharacterized protein LOC114527777 [Dendronephthya gigantea]|uniref:uncharacterized protein LOC114527777 n=1 Tax=Dendronephthya gigantea TaxID=151771 RepID=UPI00106BB073|nr:uncharacterized protein LOC114527777 [Dendronephthya gigantea]
MATAVGHDFRASRSSKNDFSDEERRWLVIGICLNKVLSPELRKVISNEMPKWYQTLIKKPTEINKQTAGKFLKSLPPSAIKLNYDSINNNTLRKSSKSGSYDYAVKDPLSLAKLFVKPFMANFTGFDHSMDISAALSVICETQAFINSGTAVFAKKVRSDVRNEWAHCDFTHWTEPIFQAALKDIESLVKKLGLTTADEKTVLDNFEYWKNNGEKLCIAKFVDSELLDLILTEVGDIQKSVTLINDDSEEKERLLRCLQNLQTSLSKEIHDLREKVCRLELEQLKLHNQYVSTVEDVEIIKNEVARMTTIDNEIPYVFNAPKQNPWFVGRLAEIEALANLLKLNEETGRKPGVSTAAVCGLGGVGKTSLATEYAQHKKDFYAGGVYWFSAENDTAFEDSVSDIATLLGTHRGTFKQTLSATLAVISRNRKPWLIVIDNMDELNLSANIVKLVSGRWQQSASGHTLMTTRREPANLANIRNFDERCCLSLKCFDIEKGKEFIFRRIGIVQKDEVVVIAEKLVQELGGLPLALEQAGAYIKSLPCTLSQYLEQYNSQRLRLLNRKEAAPISEYDNPERLAVRTTWHLNFQHIEKDVDVGKPAIRFLHASAFLNPNEIERDIINVGDPPVDDEEFKEFVKTTLGRQEILKLLTDFSLFKETPSANLTVHHLVQEVIQDNLNRDPKEKTQSLIDATRMLHYAIQNCSSPNELLLSPKDERPSIVSRDQSRFYKWNKLCLHSYEIVKHLKRIVKQTDYDVTKIFQPETAKIVYECAIHLSSNLKHDEARKVANFANDIFNSSSQSMSASSFFPHVIPLPELVRRHIQYSCNKPATNRDEESRDDVEMPINSVTTEELEEMRMKGNDMYRRGSYDDALKMYSHAIDKSKNTTFFDPRLLSNRASVYLKLGHYEKALEDAEEYIIQRPKCWKGYARKALALAELNDTQAAQIAASLAYFYERNIFRDYEPFKMKFGDSLEKLLFVCGDISELLQALCLGVPILKRMRDMSANNLQVFPVIILESRDYIVSLETIGNFNPHLSLTCILVGSGESSITFGDNVEVEFVEFFIAYRVDFHSGLTDCHFMPDSVVKLIHCSFESSNHVSTSVCCKGKLKVEHCKFYNCTQGGLLVFGDAEVENSEFFGNGVALEVREGGRLLVGKSKMYGNRRQGLVIGPWAKRCVVEDCDLYDNVLGGILAVDCESDIIMSRNRIYDNGEPGVSVIGKSNVSILENEIFKNSDWGIHINTFSRAVVKNNKIYNNQDGGIGVDVVESTEVSVIEYNDIFCNSGPGIHEQRSSTKCRGNKLHDNKKERNQSTAQSEAKLCYYCRKSGEDLKKCTKCFTAQYCGKQCQKSDWNKHKHVCHRLLSEGSIVLNYVEEPIMTYYNPNKQNTIHQRAPGLLPVGPQFCSPPNEAKRFIAKVSAGLNDTDGTKLVRLYDRSLTIDGILADADQIYTLVKQSGSVGQLYNTWKKLFMWVKGPENGKLRIFINEFPSYQEW